MSKLIVIDGSGQRSEVELDRERSCSIGRSELNDIVLADPSLSRRHATVSFSDGSWTIDDVGSSNGTFVDGRRIDAPTPLSANSQITLGGHRIAFRPDSSEAGAPQPKVVTFADRPLAPQGTVMLRADDLELTGGDTTLPAQTELEGVRRRFRAVEKANLELLAHEPMEALLPKILDLVVDAVNPGRVALLISEDNELSCRAYRGDEGQELSVSRTIANTVLSERVSVLTADAQTDARFAEGHSIAIQGIRAVMAVPLWNNKDVIGLIYADSRLSSKQFDDEDLKLLTMLANVAAIQIENAKLFEEQVEKQRFEREAKAAAEIQQRLLPHKTPELSGYLFFGHNTPCYECGGDYYDGLPLDDKRHGIVLGDVAGKGMGAAMLMAALQATFHARVDSAPEPDDLVRRLNEAIARSAPSNRFVTLFYGDLDRDQHRIRCVNAGHAPPPTLIRASGEVVEIESGGPPLGIFAGFDYPVAEFELGPGDLIFACSDGVTDVEDPEGEMYGDERLRTFLASQAQRTPEELYEALNHELEAHARGTRQPDDLTIVAVQRCA